MNAQGIGLRKYDLAHSVREAHVVMMGQICLLMYIKVGWMTWMTRARQVGGIGQGKAAEPGFYCHREADAVNVQGSGGIAL